MDLQTILNPEKLLSTVGYIGVFAVIFAESGLFFGFFLPGDSLLFTAGFFAFKYPEQFSLPILIIGCFVAAVLGDVLVHPTKGLRHIADERLAFDGQPNAILAAFCRRHGALQHVLAIWHTVDGQDFLASG